MRFARRAQRLGVRKVWVPQYSHQDARMRRSHGVVSRRDAENAEGNPSSFVVRRAGDKFLGHLVLHPNLYTPLVAARFRVEFVAGLRRSGTGPWMGESGAVAGGWRWRLGIWGGGWWKCPGRCLESRTGPWRMG
jgi:hypothetical protein